MSGHVVTGGGPELITCGYPAVGWCDQGQPLCGLKATGSTGSAAGSGSPVIGNKIVTVFQRAGLNSARTDIK